MFSASRAVQRLKGTQRGLSDKLPAPRTGRMVSLHTGDPTFDTPEYIVQAASRAMRAGYTHYPPPFGDPELREAIAAHQSKVSGVPISPSEILPTPGGTGAIYFAMAAFLDEGDEAILLDPTYSLYADEIRVVGARAVFARLTDSFRVDPDSLRAAVTPRTKMLVVNYPSNPTGRLLERWELDVLAEVACEHDLLVLSDEVYDHLVFKGKHISVLSHPALVNRTILINSLSKSFAMTGWRVGWVAAKWPLLEPIWDLSRRCVGHVNSVAQRAAVEALTNEEEGRKWQAWMLGQYDAQRTAMLEELGRMPGVYPYEAEATFYCWVRYDHPISSLDMMKFCYERGVNIRSGSEFGSLGEKHLRFTFAPSIEVITEGLAIFRAALEELRAR